MTTQEQVEESKRKMDEFKKASEPLLKYLNDNYNPHVTAIITPTSIELLEGNMSIPNIFDFVKD